MNNLESEYQQNMIELQKTYDDLAEKCDALIADNEKMSAELHKYHTDYYSAKFAIEMESEHAIDEELLIRNQISKRHANHMDGFCKEFTNKVHEMDDVLGAYDREKKAEQTLPVQIFDKFNKLNTQSDRYVLEKTKLLDGELARVTAEIEEMTCKMNETREAFVAEAIDEQNLCKLVADLKTTNVKMQLAKTLFDV